MTVNKLRMIVGLIFVASTSVVLGVIYLALKLVNII